MSDEGIRLLLHQISLNSLNTKLTFFNYEKFQVEFKERCLKIDRTVFSPSKIETLSIVFEIKTLFTLCCQRSYAKKFFLWRLLSYLKRLILMIIFILSMVFFIVRWWWAWSESKNIQCCREVICAFDNRKKDILFLGKGPTKWLYDTKLPAEAEYSINFTEQGNTFCFKSTSRQKQQ